MVETSEIQIAIHSKIIYRRATDATARTETKTNGGTDEDALDIQQLGLR